MNLDFRHIAKKKKKKVKTPKCEAKLNCASLLLCVKPLIREDGSSFQPVPFQPGTLNQQKTQGQECHHRGKSSVICNANTTLPHRMCGVVTHPHLKVGFV